MKNDASSSHLIKGLEPEGIYFFDPEKSRPEEEGLAETTTTASAINPLPKNVAVLCKLAERQGYQHGIREGHQQAYEAGWHEGFAAGSKKGEDSVRVEVKESLSALSTVIQGFSQFRGQFYEESKPEIINFCLRTCEELLHKELSDPVRHIQFIKSLLSAGKALLEAVPITIRLSETDFSSIHQTLERYPETSADFQRVHFVPDEMIQNGNCLIQTSLGLLNFDIRRQLEDIERKILSSDRENGRIQ
jgi:flagellar assembly protein FliH